MKRIVVYVDQQPVSVKTCSDDVFSMNIRNLPAGSAWMETSVRDPKDAPPFDPDKVTFA